MATLQIKQIEWANFLSYGNYSSFLVLDSLGPVLITGQRDDTKDQSNGVGKSSICIAIVWCLFGRTPKKAAPGDKVVNWSTKGDCYVKITTVDGWVITRTRKFHGHDDLTIVKDGDDKTLSTNRNAQKMLRRLFNLDYEIFISSMFFGQKTESFLEMSDIKRKATLERMLGLHRLNIWGDIAKEKRSTAEAEQNTLKALVERKKIEIKKIEDQTIQLDTKSIEFEGSRKATIDRLATAIIDLDKRIKSFTVPDLKQLKITLEAYRQETKEYDNKVNELHQISTSISAIGSEIDQLKKLITQYEARLKSFKLVNLDDLKTQHAEADQAEQDKIDLTKTLNITIANRDAIVKELNGVEATLSDWETKPDTTCPACRQAISSSHIATICKPLASKTAALRNEIKENDGLISSIQQKLDAIIVNRPQINVQTAIRDNEEINTTKLALRDIAQKTMVQINKKKELESNKENLEQVIVTIKPSIDRSNIEVQIEEAEIAQRKYDEFQRALSECQAKLLDETNKHNPYGDLKNGAAAELARAKDELSADLLSVAKLDDKIKQYDYIRHSYHDRNKIKMFILSELVPYFNQRIEYYLDAFDCDLTLKFTSTLTIDTSRWDYDFHSGGQQKRIDLAILFALYDLYILMYGQQCNVMVLDEVDGSLDAQGVRMFVDIIMNDFAGDRPDKPDTILIISHKNEMVDQFANQILVTQDISGFSHVQQP